MGTRATSTFVTPMVLSRGGATKLINLSIIPFSDSHNFTCCVHTFYLLFPIFNAHGKETANIPQTGKDLLG